MLEKLKEIRLEKTEREESERGERLRREPHLSLRKNDPEEAVSECGPDSKAMRGHWKLVRCEAQISGVREAARTRVNRARVMTVMEWSGDSAVAQDHGKKWDKERNLFPSHIPVTNRLPE